MVAVAWGAVGETKRGADARAQRGKWRDEERVLTACVHATCACAARARASVCVQLSKQAGEDKAFGQFERWYNEDAEATFNQTRAEIAVSWRACACMHTHLRW